MTSDRDALVSLLQRVSHVLVANWPTDPHTHQPGGGHVCDAECEQEYHYACLVNDVKSALATLAQRGEGHSALAAPAETPPATPREDMR